MQSPVSILVTQHIITPIKWFFGNLVQFFAIGVYGINHKEEVKIVTGEYDEGKKISFRNFEQKKISGIKSRVRNTLVAKIYNVVTYNLDIACYISISPVTNVSRSLGFDSCLGIYSTD